MRGKFPEHLGGYVDLATQILKPEGRRFAVLEGNQDCNRSCSYCAVPKRYNPNTELTLIETNNAVDWLYKQGYRVLSYRGGETLAPFKTKEGITFTEHTLGVVKHAKDKGMFLNVTTNGDFITSKDGGVLASLQEAGLDSLTLSLHTYTMSALNHLIKAAHAAADHRIIPSVQTVMTSQTADKLPAIAAEVAKNGVLFAVGIVQVHGDGFSQKQDQSVIPTLEQQKRVFAALRSLKTWGFVRENMKYLSEAQRYHPNQWLCDATRDNFIAIGAGGKVNVCSSVETGLRLGDVLTLSDTEWRKRKEIGVANCSGCRFHCYFEAENPDIVRDASTILMATAIKLGQSALVVMLGKIAVKRSKAKILDVEWDLESVFTKSP